MNCTTNPKTEREKQTMAKKALTLILILTLILTFTACGSKTKWPLAEGVYVENSAGQVTYVCMEVKDGTNYFTMGVDSDASYFSGTVSDIHKISDNTYDFTATDGTETLVVTCEITEEGSLFMNFNGGGQAVFKYAAPSLDGFNPADFAA